MIKYSELPEERKEKMREAHRDWAARNPRTKYYNNYEKSMRGDRFEYKMFISARSRAKKAELPFDITEDDIKIPLNCPICDVELKVAKGIRGGSRNSPTLDRVIGEYGYTKTNIAVICKNCNSIKGHGSAEELRRIADWMDNNC